MTAKAEEGVNKADLAQAIEPAAVLAWPARETRELKGWLLRFTNGFTHRGNSVATLVFSGDDVADTIAEVERDYEQRGLAPMFQVASHCAPADLADRLMRCGYRETTPTLVQTTTPTQMSSRLPAPGAIRVAPRATADFAGLVVTGSRSAGDGQERLEILERIGAACACVTALVDGEAVSCGTATNIDGYVGVNLMRTTIAHRRKGHARRVLAAIAGWAKEQRAHTVYLGVEKANAPAIALYQSASFEAGYSYRYLVKA